MVRSAERGSVTSQAHAADPENQLIRAAAHPSTTDAQLAAADADRARLTAELDAATRDVASLEAELALVRKELADACIDESRLHQSESKVASMSAELAACRKAAGRPHDSRPLDQVIAGLRQQAEGFTRLQGSRSYAMIARYRRVLGHIAPAGSRRRSAYRLLTKGRRRS